MIGLVLAWFGVTALMLLDDASIQHNYALNAALLVTGIGIGLCLADIVNGPKPRA